MQFLKPVLFRNQSQEWPSEALRKGKKEGFIWLFLKPNIGLAQEFWNSSISWGLFNLFSIACGLMLVTHRPILLNSYGQETGYMAIISGFLTHCTAWRSSNQSKFTNHSSTPDLITQTNSIIEIYSAVFSDDQTPGRAGICGWNMGAKCAWTSLVWSWPSGHEGFDFCALLLGHVGWSFAGSVDGFGTIFGIGL